MGKSIADLDHLMTKFTANDDKIDTQKGHNMWLEKVRELKKSTGMTNKCIAEKTHRSERTVARFFAGETDFGIDGLREIVLLMGGSLDDILEESDFKMPTPELDALKKENTTLLETIEEMTANEKLYKAELSLLRDKVAVLTAENDLLNLQLKHKDELLAVHNYYNKFKQNN